MYLAELDKGLSGSQVWLARWELRSGHKSQYHVFKIGNYQKLNRELEAAQFASTIDDLPQMVLLPPHPAPGIRKGLLRQRFMGGSGGGLPKSLRKHLVVIDSVEAAEVLGSLYLERMSKWHGPDDEYSEEEAPLGEAIDRWKDVDLLEGARGIGKDGLEASLAAAFATDVERLEGQRRELLTESEAIAVGPVHGDLHSQNVLVTNGHLELIDYQMTGEKWRALDFLMMECSLKFLCGPPHARLTDLIELEARLDPVLAGEPFDARPLMARIYGSELAKIGAAVAVVRALAQELGAVSSGSQYRRGLYLMTAGLAELPEQINRVFLFHSLGYHYRALSA